MWNDLSTGVLEAFADAQSAFYSREDDVLHCGLYGFEPYKPVTKRLWEEDRLRTMKACYPARFKEWRQKLNGYNRTYRERLAVNDPGILAQWRMAERQREKADPMRREKMSAKNARAWQRIKADPARHAARLEKRRAQYASKAAA